MEIIYFPCGKLSMNFKNNTTLIYTKNDTNQSYVGSIETKFAKCICVLTTIINVYTGYVELVLNNMTTFILIEIKNDDLIRDLALQISTLYSECNKLTNIIHNSLRIMCVNDQMILLGSQCLELYFSKKYIEMFTTKQKSFVWCNTNKSIHLYDEMSDMLATSLIVNVDESNIIEFDWLNLPKLISEITFTNNILLESFVNNISNININIKAIHMVNMTINNDFLELIMNKWPDIHFSINNRPFVYFKNIE